MTFIIQLRFWARLSVSALSILAVNVPVVRIERLGLGEVLIGPLPGPSSIGKMDAQLGTTLGRVHSSEVRRLDAFGRFGPATYAYLLFAPFFTQSSIAGAYSSLPNLIAPRACFLA